MKSLTDSPNVPNAGRMNTSQNAHPSHDGRASGWRRGMMQAMPIVMGYIPVGFAYGVLSQKAGLSPVNGALMSLLVYAGAAQFIAVSLIMAQTPPMTILLTTFIVNLRHLMMASAIAPHLQKWRKRELAAFGFELTDETFALHSTRFPSGVPPKSEIFATNLTSQTAWVAGSCLGVLAGGLISDVKPYGLDYALTALFIALVVLQVTNWMQLTVACVTGIISVALFQAGMERWNVMLATGLGATIGVGIEQWNNRRSSS